MNIVNALLHMNCMDFMQHIADLTFEHIITDVPYSVVNRKSNGLRNFNKEQADILSFDLEAFIDLACKKVKKTMFVFCASEQVSVLIDRFEENDFTTTLAIWEKNNPSPVNGQYMWLSGLECCIIAERDPKYRNKIPPIWKFSSGRSKFHPTEKPLALLEHIITTYTKEGDFIYDPCSGSASTLEAAAIHNRIYCGTEVYADYFLYGKKRLEKYF